MRALVVLVLLAACGDDGPAYSVERLQDPNTCLDCHPTHYTEWSGSMHAYATTDPVFRAMHARGQRETGGELGMFCVNCHAPMAVARGTITPDNVRDFDFATLAPSDNGITCYFCHNVDKVTGDHNNPLVLAMDQRMRGGIRDAADTPAHHNGYSPLMDNDSTSNDSSMCGACHDIVNPLGVHVERTFAEWKTTVFATNEDPVARVSCGSCHMEPRTGVIAEGPGLNVGRREFGLHDHKLVGIDLALNEFPQRTEQDAALRSFLAGTVAIKGPKPRTSNRAPGGICVQPNGSITVRVDSFTVGHNFPSGAAFDRRSWLEVIAYDAETGGNVVFQSGVVPDGVDPEDIGDAKLAGFWDRARKGNGDVAHFLWEVASIDDAPGDVILPAITLDQNDPRFDHSVTATYTNVPIAMVQRVEARLLIRPLAFEVLHDLVDSGDLDPAVLAEVKTLEVSRSTWLRSTMATGPAVNTPCNPE